MNLPEVGGTLAGYGSSVHQLHSWPGCHRHALRCLNNYGPGQFRKKLSPRIERNRVAPATQPGRRPRQHGRLVSQPSLLVGNAPPSHGAFRLAIFGRHIARSKTIVRRDRTGIARERGKRAAIQIAWARARKVSKKVPPPTSEGYEGRLFPPEHLTDMTLRARLQDKNSENQELAGNFAQSARSGCEGDDSPDFLNTGSQCRHRGPPRGR